MDKIFCEQDLHGPIFGSTCTNNQQGDTAEWVFPFCLYCSTKWATGSIAYWPGDTAAPGSDCQARIWPNTATSSSRSTRLCTTASDCSCQSNTFDICGSRCCRGTVVCTRGDRWRCTGRPRPASGCQAHILLPAPSSTFLNHTFLNRND